MLKIFLVALGGSIGATARYLISDWAAQRWGADFPYGTLIVNIAGCFIIGLFMALVTERIIVSPYWRLLVTVGFVGGLTTFSSFSYETIKLVNDGQMTFALYNILSNFVLGFFATWTGISLAKLF
ncbi:CrcB protein [Thermosinus carboxydivorans Nor1]|uniref:Fluoride-specific ion channel FluC n=1 Tax=Thermosinus carboxydivorans Nor1 TaxID=401526 RepID=A1HUA9_9FIRM|nr:fluoride efflux transporter CrcB [Thermosinus carboxydivorans]EAX46388.1 CrcB protein [Thermosinus carboxydivorans Nor1]